MPFLWLRKNLFSFQALWTVDDSEFKIGHEKNWYICKRQDIVTHRISKLDGNLFIFKSLISPLKYQLFISMKEI